MSLVMERLEQIRQLHQPDSSLAIPGIIQNAASCVECRKAWPCATYELTTSKRPQETQRCLTCGKSISAGMDLCSGCDGDANPYY